MVRGLQLLLGSSKHAIIERTEVIDNENDAIPLTDTREIIQGSQDSQGSQGISITSLSTTPMMGLSVANSITDLIPPKRIQNPGEVQSTGGPPVSDIKMQEKGRIENLRQVPVPLTRPQKWAAFINTNFRRVTYGALFFCVSLPYSVRHIFPALV